MQQQQLDPIWLFISAFVIAASAGVAGLLRSTKALTLRVFVATILNSGALGLGIAMLLFNWYKDNTWFLLGLCLLAGMGGMTCIGLIMMIIRNKGLKLDIYVNKSEDKPQQKIQELEDDDSIK